MFGKRKQGTAEHKSRQAPNPAPPASARTGSPILGVYKPGLYKEKAKEFLRECVGEEIYGKVMNCDAGRLHHYVPARVLLSQPDWEKFCWIEQYGTLDGFPG